MFFFKWPLEYKSQFLIDLEKKILVSKYTFSGPTITQKAIKNTLNLFFISMVVIFQNCCQNMHVLISPFLINVEKSHFFLNGR